MVTPLSRIKTMKSKLLILDVEIPPKTTLVEWGMGLKKKKRRDSSNISPFSSPRS